VDISRDLLNAQMKTSSPERLRVSAAINAALDEPIRNPAMSAVEAVETAEEAIKRANRDIAGEKNPKPKLSETQSSSADGFGEDSVASAVLDEVDPNDGAEPATPASYLPAAETAADQETEDGEGPDPDRDFDLDLDHDRDLEDSDNESDLLGDLDGPPQYGSYSELPPAWEPPRTEPADKDVTSPPAGSRGDDATDPHIRIPQTSPDGSEELPPRFAAAVNQTTPQPASKATEPPEKMEEPGPDDEQSFAERMRESAGSVLSQFRGDGERSRARWLLAGSAAVLAIVLVAMFSLSGGRGKAPEPAGTVAAPPAQTENPSATPAASVLVPATVSASCVGDTDALALFEKEKSRAWVCGRTNELDGSVLNITFRAPVVITEITIVPGFNYVAPDGRDEWERHRLVTGVTWRMGGKTYPQTINPTRTGTVMKFPSVITKEMSMTITASTRPPKSSPSGIGKPGSDNSADVDANTAVSSIVITGYPVDPGS